MDGFLFDLMKKSEKNIPYCSKLNIINYIFVIFAKIYTKLLFTMNSLRPLIGQYISHWNDYID